MQLAVANASLSPDDFIFYVNGEESRFVSVQPGDTLEFDLGIRNEFPVESHLDFSKASVKFIIRHIQSGEDIVKSHSDISIIAGQQIIVSDMIHVPDTAAAGTYQYVAEIRTTTADGLPFFLPIFGTIQVDVLDEVIVEEILAPQKVECMIPMRVTVNNNGEEEAHGMLNLRQQKNQYGQTEVHLLPHQQQSYAFDITLPDGVASVLPFAADLTLGKTTRSDFVFVDIQCTRSGENSPSHTKNTYLTPIVEIHQQKAASAGAGAVLFSFFGWLFS